MSLPIDHGIELIRAFFDDRAEREMREVYYFAQPNGINQEKSLADFLGEAAHPAIALKTEGEIMESVKDILSQFERGSDRGNI